MDYGSSSYWYNKYQTYKLSKEKNEELKKKYESSKTKLETLKKDVESAKSNMKTGKSNFTNGGYVNAGEGLYSNQIDNIITVLSDSATTLSNAITFSEERLKVLENAIVDYKNKMEYALSEYRKAKAREANAG